MNQGIYGIRKIGTSRVYVGSARRIDNRWRRHLKMLGDGCHHSRALQSAWSKHGADSFEFYIIELVAAVADLICREQHWIDTLRAYGHGYNGRPKADSNLGRPMTERQRAALRAARLGVKQSPEHIEAARLTRLGKKRSEETKRRMSDAAKVRYAKYLDGSPLRGRKRPAEVVEKVAAANCGKKRSAEARAKMSASRKQMMEDPALRAAIAEQRRGSKASPEARANMSAAKRGKPLSPETLAKWRAANVGRKRTPEQCARISESLKGRKVSPEAIAKAKATKAANGYRPSEKTKAKNGAAHRGRTRSPEARERIRQGALKREAARRALRA